MTLRKNVQQSYYDDIADSSMCGSNYWHGIAPPNDGWRRWRSTGWRLLYFLRTQTVFVLSRIEKFAGSKGTYNVFKAAMMGSEGREKISHMKHSQSRSPQQTRNNSKYVGPISRRMCVYTSYSFAVCRPSSFPSPAPYLQQTRGCPHDPKVEIIIIRELRRCPVFFFLPCLSLLQGRARVLFRLSLFFCIFFYFTLFIRCALSLAFTCLHRP